jgi:hypothetical protein
MNNILLIPFVYELVILFIALLFEGLIIKQNSKKRSKLKTFLLLQFLFYTIAIAFSCYGKYLRFINDVFPESITGMNRYLFGLIWDLRLALCSMVFGIIYSFKFKIELFDSDKPLNQNNKIFIGIGCIIAATSIFLYEPGVQLYTLIVFGLIFIYDALVYIPLFVKSIQLANRVEDKKHKKAIFSISFMALCLVSIFLSFLLDQLILMLYFTRFSIFYYLAWFWAILGFISSYFGYIKPAK